MKCDQAAPPPTETASPGVLPPLCESVALTMMQAANAITADTRWSDLGADSLDFVEILYHLEDSAGVDFGDADLAPFNADTVGETAALIDAALLERAA